MSGQYSALTKRDNGDGTLTITDTINGTEERWEQSEWDNPNGQPISSGQQQQPGGQRPGGRQGKDKHYDRSGREIDGGDEPSGGGFRDSRMGQHSLSGWGR